MDLLSGFVAWLLMIFMQACPAERLAAGDNFYYNLDSQNKTLLITVSAKNEKEAWLSLTAGIQEPGLPKPGLDKIHHATLSFGRGRAVTSFREGTQELLTKPLVFGPLEKQLLISTAADYLFVRSKQAPPPLTMKSVAGYSGAIKNQSARYEQGQDLIDLGTDANLGLTVASFTQGGDITGLQLVKVELHRKRPR